MAGRVQATNVSAATRTRTGGCRQRPCGFRARHASVGRSGEIGLPGSRVKPDELPVVIAWSGLDAWARVTLENS